MAGSRTLTALVGLGVSLAVTVALWWYFDTLLVFLLVPFVPFLFRGMGREETPPVRECPRCGFRSTVEDHDYCPRDGSRLEPAESR
ncbi:hypothetical protein ACFQGE_11860 [Halomicroarcula sp. GCM10025817]|uniref:hypothetical protein n=1 Tax=Haloarcula TaxID=2237 RepID=UPI0023E7831E|nr:hypothetical protein [Halomicroarcula sp. SYNS111]